MSSELQPVEIEHVKDHPLTINVPGDPRAKARVKRARNGHAYVDKQTTAHQEWLALNMRRVVRRPLVGGVAIEVVFYRSNLQRIDVDNMMKAVLDAATGVLWVDDVQVVKLAGSIELDRANPRTEIVLYEHSTSMPRGAEADLVKICPRCGVEFVTRAYKSKPGGATFCSRACTLNPDATCEGCGTSYRKNSVAQRFCTKACAAASKETRRKISAARIAAATPPNNCRRCGARLARRSAVLCRPCWLSRGPDGMKGVRKADIEGTS